VAIADIQIRTWQGAYAHVFPAEGLASLETGRERREAFWRSTIQSKPARSHTLVAEEDDAVVGFASVGPDRDDPEIGELYAIYVFPQKWGAGAGRALMGEVLRHLRAEAFAEAVLWVLDDNPRARAFYERSGWSLEGGAREETLLDTFVREVKYRIGLGGATDIA